VADQRTWGPKGHGLEQGPLYMYIFRSIYGLASCKLNREAPSFHKFQQFINLMQKMQPEMKSNEYSSGKIIS